MQLASNGDAGHRPAKDCAVAIIPTLDEAQSIGAVVRGSEVIMAHHDTVIEAEDHVILFLTDRRHVEDVGRLFQAGIRT